MPVPDNFSIKLPDLISITPFPSAIHPERYKGTEESIAWICSEETLGTKDTYAHWVKLFKRWDVPLLSAYALPYATYDKYRFCSDILNMLFALDELTDSLSGEEAKEQMDLHVRVLLGGQCDGSPISRMTSSIRDRIKQNFRPVAYERFCRVYQEFADAVIYEAHLRSKKEALPVKDYIIQRRKSGGALPCFTLIEACLDLEIPDEAMDHPVLKRMNDQATDIILWANDLFSYKKERIQDGPKCLNMVTSLIYNNGLSLQGAVDFVGTEIELTLTQFLLDKKILPSFGAAIDEEIKAYIIGLEYWVTGNLLFSLESKRYINDEERARVKETLVIEIPIWCCRKQ